VLLGDAIIAMTKGEDLRGLARMFSLTALLFGICHGLIVGAGTWMRKGGNYLHHLAAAPYELLLGNGRFEGREELILANGLRKH